MELQPLSPSSSSRPWTIAPSFLQAAMLAQDFEMTTSQLPPSPSLPPLVDITAPPRWSFRWMDDVDAPENVARWPLVMKSIRDRRSQLSSNTSTVSGVLQCVNHATKGSVCREECKHQFWIINGATAEELDAMEAWRSRAQDRPHPLGRTKRKKIKLVPSAPAAFRCYWDTPLTKVRHRWPLTAKAIKERRIFTRLNPLLFNLLPCSRHIMQTCSEECGKKFWTEQGATEDELNVIEARIKDEEVKPPPPLTPLVTEPVVENSEIITTENAVMVMAEELKRVLDNEAKLLQEAKDFEEKMRLALGAAKQRVQRLSVQREHISSLLKL